MQKMPLLAIFVANNQLLEILFCYKCVFVDFVLVKIRLDGRESGT